MLYLLLYPLHTQYPPLNVFKYITFRMLLAALTALTLSLILGPLLIKRLQALQIGQAIRSDGPAAHAVKAGTPTMGGTLILFALIAATLLLADLNNQYVWIAVAVTLGHGLIGFVDDWAKVSRRSSAGVPGKLRLAGEFAIGAMAAAAVYALSPPDHAGHVTMPFLKDVQPDLGLWYIPFGAFVVVAAANAVNLTDGLDGLAIGPVMIAGGTYAVFSYAAGHARIAEYLQIPYVPGAGELAVFCGALAAAGLGFLWFNAYPAQMFMGDVGSLALGAALGTVALITRQEIVLVIVGGVFVVETLSVIGQVVSFRLRRKRIFRMAPIHHHFELLGWPEPQIIVRFWIVSIVCALLALSTLKLR
jgi:phospho-N-acetylmuramoyl-pentapeptide-transferase